jgi:hypothetical protein
MAIVNRISNGSALTHLELDGNFTDLDGRVNALDTRVTTEENNVDTLQTNFTTLGATNLTNSTADLDISGLITNNDSFDDLKLKRVSVSDASPRVVGVFETHYDLALQNNLGTGIWHRVAGTNGFLEMGESGVELISFTDANNYTGSIRLKPYSRSSGTGNADTVLRLSHNDLEVTNTDEIELNSIPLSGLKLKPTAYAQLPSNTGSGDDGLVAYLTTDGAGANKFQLIYSIGGAWRYVTDGSVVAAS